MTLSASTASTMSQCVFDGVAPPVEVAWHAMSASAFEADLPATIYQTSVAPDGSQDGSTPLVMRIKLSAGSASALAKALRSGSPLTSLVYVAIRRMDLRELEVYDTESKRLLGLRLSQSMFDFDFRPGSGLLAIHVHRKELPVSANFGDAPFVFTVRLKASDELVVSSIFHIASKEPVNRAPRPPPKRVRAPSVRVPIPAPAAGEEAEINNQCKAFKKRARVDGVVKPPPSPLSSHAFTATASVLPSSPASCASSVAVGDADFDASFAALFEDDLSSAAMAADMATFPWFDSEEEMANALALAQACDSP